MSIEARTWAYDTAHDTKQRTLRKFVLVTLADYADARGACFPSLKELAWKTDMCVNTVRARLYELVESGFVYLSGRVRETSNADTSNEYVLLMSDAARAYAAEKGWVPGLAPEPVLTDRRRKRGATRDPRQLDIFPQAANQEPTSSAPTRSLASTAPMSMSPTPSTCMEGGTPPAWRGGLHLHGVLEPLTEPSTEPFPKAPEIGAVATGLGEGDSAGPEKDLWLSFSDTFPENTLDLDEPARRAWNRLSRQDRADATRFALSFIRESRAQGHKLKHRVSYLRDRAWTKFAEAEGRAVAIRCASVPIAASSAFHAALLDGLRAGLRDDAAFQAWFSDLGVVAVKDGLATLSLPTKFLRSEVLRRYEAKILAAATVADCGVTRIAIDIVAKPSRPPEVGSAAPNPVEPHSPRQASMRQERA